MGSARSGPRLTWPVVDRCRRDADRLSGDLGPAEPQACQAQSVATAAALARAGCEVTLLLPRGRGRSRPDGQPSCANGLAWRATFGVVQRPSRWAGDGLVHRTLLWLRQVFGDPATRGADLFYSRIPAMVGIGQLAPNPFATEQYRPWPDDWPWLRPRAAAHARHRDCLGLILHSRYAAEAYRRAGVPEERLLVAHNGFDPPARAARQGGGDGRGLGCPPTARSRSMPGGSMAPRASTRCSRWPIAGPKCCSCWSGPKAKARSSARRHGATTSASIRGPSPRRCRPGCSRPMCC